VNYNSLATVAVDYNSPVAMNTCFVSVASVRCHARLLLNRVTVQASGQTGPAGFSSVYIDWVRPNPKNKIKEKKMVEIEPGLLSLLWIKDVIGKTHPYSLPLYFHPFLF
jgi:hypothetical protein